MTIFRQLLLIFGVTTPLNARFTLPSLPLAVVACIGVLNISSQSAQALRITTSIGDYDVETQIGRFDNIDFRTNVLEEQIWWDNTSLAREFAQLVGFELGRVNPPDSFFTIGGPYFATGSINDINFSGCARFRFGGVSCNNNLQGQNDRSTFAVATPVTPVTPVPEPLTILGTGTAILFGAGFKHKLTKAKKK